MNEHQQSSETGVDNALASGIDRLATIFEQHLKSERKKQRNAKMRLVILAAPLFVMLYMVMADMIRATYASMSKEYVAVVKLRGAIGDGKGPSTGDVIRSLNSAFEDSRAKGVVLHVNSPGGGATASVRIREKIDDLRAAHPDKRFIVVASDMIASGGYLIGSAGDKIYANQTSLVGSIGVIMQSFGVGDALEKLGIEPRVFTAGENKARFDAFSDVSADDRAKIESMLVEIHEVFKDFVIAGRGDRLAGNIDELFSGDIWVGTQAKELGLIDGFASLSQAIESEFGTDNARDYGPNPAAWEQILQASQNLLQAWDIGAHVQQGLRMEFAR